MAQKMAISAGAVILREVEGQLKIALAHRTRTNKAWVLPKGHVEKGESLEQAALREIYEETGLKNVQLIKYLGSIPRESIKSNGDVEQKTIHYYLAYALREKEPQPPSDKGFIEPGWFCPEEAIKLLPYENDRAFLREHLHALFNVDGSELT